MAAQIVCVDRTVRAGSRVEEEEREMKNEKKTARDLEKIFFSQRRKQVKLTTATPPTLGLRDF